jgi:hypothetical protein
MEDFPLSPAQLQRVQTLTSADQRLYDWATERHERIYSQMLSRLGFANHSSAHDTPEFSAQVNRALDTAAAKRREARRENDDTADWFEVVSTDGFLAGHLNRDWRRYIQWIGPRPEAKVRLDFRRVLDMLLYVRVDFALKKSMLDHFTVRLNGERIPLLWNAAGRAHHFVGFVPREIIGADGADSALVLQTSSADSPADLAPYSTDHERKCLAISCIDLRPAVMSEPLETPAAAATPRILKGNFLSRWTSRRREA